MGIEILKGNSLNDWFCFEVRVCNFFNFEASVFGYGIKILWLLNDVVKKTFEVEDDA